MPLPDEPQASADVSVSWWSVTLAVDPDDAELAADVLWRSGAPAVEERTEGERTVLFAAFADRGVAEAAAEAADRGGFGPGAIERVLDDGLDGWRTDASPIEAPPFLLVPSWRTAGADGATTLEAAAAGGLVPLLVDPGRTFGSGSHATTRLVLGHLPRIVAARTRVLDVGTGSGVLAVAAALLGASEVVGIDVDPGSPEAVAANAQRNGVGDRIEGSLDPVGSVVERCAPFDVVLANLLAPVIVELGADLVRATAREGALVVSGLLADRWERVLPHLAPLEVVDVASEDGWVAAVLRRPTDGHQARR